MIRRRTGTRQWAGKTVARMELYATARQIDAAAAEIRLHAEDDFITDAHADELEAIYRRLRRVIEDIDEVIEDIDEWRAAL